MLRAVVLLLAWTAPAPDAPAGASSPAPGDAGELRGVVVCLDEAGRRQTCTAESRRFALETAEGELLRFGPEDPLLPVFRDPRLRDRELRVLGRPRADGAVDILKVYSAKQGKLHAVHFFCELCNVTAYAPGPCPCCRQEMELRETPVP